MRRKDKEVTDISEKIAILDKCKVCRLGLCDDGMPYVVPLNYGYTFENGELTLYFHGAAEGMKLDIAKKNKNACFEADCGHALIRGDRPEQLSFAFESIIAFGEVEFVNDAKEKSDALNVIVRHQTEKPSEVDFGEDVLKVTCVLKMSVSSFTGKRRLPKQND